MEEGGGESVAVGQRLGICLPGRYGADSTAGGGGLRPGVPGGAGGQHPYPLGHVDFDDVRPGPGPSGAVVAWCGGTFGTGRGTVGLLHRVDGAQVGHIPLCGAGYEKHLPRDLAGGSLCGIWAAAVGRCGSDSGALERSGVTDTAGSACGAVRLHRGPV